MSYAEKYVSPTGGGSHDGSTPANAWTPTERASNAVAGDRCNWIGGAYSVSGLTFANSGTYNSRIIDRGYSSVIGDLETQGRNSDTSLNTTNFPIITTSASIVPSPYNILQNIYFTGSFAGVVLNGASPDFVTSISCKYENTLNNSSARVADFDNDVNLISNDFECTGATHGTVLSCDSRIALYGNRIRGVDNTATLATIRDVKGLVANAFMGGGIGLRIETMSTAWLIVANTFYNQAITEIQTPNSAATRDLILINNHSTDSARWLQNLYASTADHFAIEINTRTRDNTTPRTGFGDSLNIGEVTTDTGGAETDYVNAGDGNLRLISGAPGETAGLIAYEDIGAYQREPSGGSGGGFLLANKRGGKQ